MTISAVEREQGLLSLIVTEGVAVIVHDEKGEVQLQWNLFKQIYESVQTFPFHS